MGKLQKSIRYFRRALRYYARRNIGALWGLAVALDRDEQAVDAMRAARAARQLDPGLRELTRPGVFFVPRGEVEYYLAMAHEAGGANARALAHWSRFLKALPKSPWAIRARAHVKKLRGTLGRATAVVRSAGRPALVQGLAAAPAWSRTLTAAALGAVQACYRQRLKKLPCPEGMFELVLTVDRGAVIRAVASGHRSGDPGRDPTLRQCLSNRLRNRRLKGMGRGRTTRKVSLYYDLKLKF